MTRGQKSKYDPQKHHRKSNRLRGYDYAQAGAYFVTICTHQRECLFGEIVAGKMILNQVGKIVQWEWENLAQRFPFIELGAFVVMPNHFHGILIFHDSSVGATHSEQISINNSNQPVPDWNSSDHDGAPLPNESLPQGPKPGALGAIIGQFKSRVTKRIWKNPTWQGDPIWQRNYHDRIIRDDREFENTWRYIEANSANWDEDTENLSR